MEVYQKTRLTGSGFGGRVESGWVEEEKLETAEEILLETRILRAKRLRTRKVNLYLQFILVWLVPAALGSIAVTVIGPSLLPVPLVMVFATGLAAFGGAMILYQQLELLKEVEQARAEGVQIEDP